MTHGKGATPVMEVLAFLAWAYPGARALLDYRNTTAGSLPGASPRLPTIPGKKEMPIS